MLPVADGRRNDRLATGNQEGHVRVREPERSEPLQLLGEVEREVLRRDERVDDGHLPKVAFGQHGVRMLAECSRERLDPGRIDRKAGSSSVTSEALQMRGAGRERAVQVEARDRAAGSLPRVLSARDQHDGPLEALDEPRSDDPDHALVPVLAREDVGAAAALALRKRVDTRNRFTEDPVLDRLSIAIQILELGRELLVLERRPR